MLPPELVEELSVVLGKMIAHRLNEYEREVAELEAMSTDDLLDEMDRLEREVHFSDAAEQLGEHDPAIGRFDQVDLADDIRRAYGRKFPP
jgi:hypothetical protein